MIQQAMTCPLYVHLFEYNDVTYAKYIVYATFTILISVVVLFEVALNSIAV